MPHASRRAIHALYRKVYEGKPKYEETTGGVTRSKLVENKNGVIVSKARHQAAVKNKIVNRVKPWLAHVEQYYKTHSVSYKEALQKAKATYKKGSAAAAPSGGLRRSSRLNK